MSSANEQWEQLLTPAVLKERFVSVSFYVIGFEILKDSIIGRIRSFYSIGFDSNGEILDEKYKTNVLSKSKSVLDASLNWLLENGVIDQDDIQAFERIRTTRNSLVHQLPSMVLGGKEFNHIERFPELVALLRKIEVWWIVNLEISCNPDFDGKEINEEGIVPGPILMLQMMLEVLSGSEKLLNYYQRNSNS